MAINFLGTWEQKENKPWNKETKAYFREQGTPKSKKFFFKERGNTKKILLGTREHGLPPSPLPWAGLDDGLRKDDASGTVCFSGQRIFHALENKMISYFLFDN